MPGQFSLFMAALMGPKKKNQGQMPNATRQMHRQGKRMASKMRCDENAATKEHPTPVFRTRRTVKRGEIDGR